MPDADVFAANDLSLDILKLNVIALDRADARAAGACAEDTEDRCRVLLQDADSSAADGTDVHRAVGRDLDRLRVQKSADLYCTAQDRRLCLDVSADPARAGGTERPAVDAVGLQRAGRAELVRRKRLLRPQRTGDGRKPLYLHRLRGKVARGRQAAAADAPGYLARAARVQFARAVHVALHLRRAGAVQLLAFEAAVDFARAADRDLAVFTARHAARAGNFHIDVFVHNVSSFRCSRISVLCAPSARYKCRSSSRG